MRLAWILALLPLGVPQDKQAPKRLDDPAKWGIGQAVEDFEYRDLDGRRGSLGELARGAKAVVVALTSADCPVSKLYRPKLERLEGELARKGVRLALLPADPAIAGPLRATRTTDVFLFDAARVLRYRGAIDDQYGIGYRRDAPRENYLLDAVAALLAGRDIAVPATEAPGCPIETGSVSSNGEVTFHRDVQPILQRSCVECHRPGEVGPFALQTFEQARSMGQRIREAVTDRRMPPWFASPEHGSWTNDRRLTKAEVEKLQKWIDGGMAEGNPKDAPPARTFTDGWKIGTPDLVLKMTRPTKVKAEGTMPYRYSTVRTNLTEDRWVQAIEVRPGNREVVHHILIFLATKKRGLRDLEETGGGLESYFGIMVPGEEPTVFAEGEGKLLPAGSSIVFQVHYTPNGTATEDQSIVGFRFAKKPVEREVVTRGIYNTEIEIPAGAANHVETAELVLEDDIEIRSYLPHLHVRGRAFRYEAVYPDDRREVLLDVPKYDFNWQFQYRPREPKRLPKGTKILVTAAYDNSASNPANPNPKKVVRFGEQTDEEMLIGYIDYVKVR